MRYDDAILAIIVILAAVVLLAVGQIVLELRRDK